MGDVEMLVLTGVLSAVFFSVLGGSAPWKRVGEGRMSGPGGTTGLAMLGSYDEEQRGGRRERRETTQAGRQTPQQEADSSRVCCIYSCICPSVASQPARCMLTWRAYGDRETDRRLLSSVAGPLPKN